MLQRVQRRGELVSAQIENGQVKQQSEIIGSERQGLSVMIGVYARIALAHKELSGRVMSSRYFFDCSGASRSRVVFKLGDVAKIDRIVMNSEASNIIISANGINLGS